MPANSAAGTAKRMAPAGDLRLDLELADRLDAIVPDHLAGDPAVKLVSGVAVGPSRVCTVRQRPPSTDEVRAGRSGAAFAFVSAGLAASQVCASGAPSISLANVSGVPPLSSQSSTSPFSGRPPSSSTRTEAATGSSASATCRAWSRPGRSLSGRITTSAVRK